MPLYEYRCTRCGRVFEERRSVMERDEPARCPFCGEEKTERKQSSFWGRVSGGSSCRTGFT